MQHRDDLALGYPVDVKIVPDVECAEAVSAWIGQEPAMDITELTASTAADVAPAAVDELAARKQAYASDNTHEAETTERMSLCAMRVNDLHVPRGLTSGAYTPLLSCFSSPHDGKHAYFLPAHTPPAHAAAAG